ncbi:MAG: hypothetical protein JNK26_01875 [Candidatus Doudnabacteria bacterium]|nr:hypothetical protein [Candidatus Doudnabacteria bacterium]
MKPAISQIVTANLDDPLFIAGLKSAATITEEIIKDAKPEDMFELAEDIQAYLNNQLEEVPAEIVEGLTGILGAIHLKLGWGYHYPTHEPS